MSSQKRALTQACTSHSRQLILCIAVRVQRLASVAPALRTVRPLPRVEPLGARAVVSQQLYAGAIVFLGKRKDA